MLSMMGIKKSFYIFSLSSLIYSNTVFANTIDQMRMLNIAQTVIRMQIINDPKAANNLQHMAELIVNSKAPQDTAQILAPIPPQGIAQHLREVNIQTLQGQQAQQMLAVINTEIDQISQMFKHCKTMGTVEEKAPELYAVAIECYVPQPSVQAQQDYQQQLATLSQDNFSQYKIQHLKLRHDILAQSNSQPFIAELLFDTSKTPIYRPMIEEDDYFPNIVISKRSTSLLAQKVATQD